MVQARRVRLVDIAELARVTPSTVSRVLNATPDSARIPQSTRDRVLRIATELRYVPDPTARGLRTGRGFLVPLLVPDLTGPMVGAFYRSVVTMLAPAGLAVIMAEAGSLSAEGLGRLGAGSVAGIILVGRQDDAEDLPQVRVAPGTQPGVGRGPVVRVDHAGGAIQVADHLHGLGHRRATIIVHGGLADVTERSVFADRIASYGDGGTVDRVEVGELTLAAGRAAMAAVMQRPDPPTAVFAAADSLALGALLWCLEHEVDVPGRVSVVGFDDVPLAADVPPGLTTVRQPVEELGRAAARALTAVLAAPDAAVPDVVLTTELVVRGSTGPVPTT